MAKKYQTDGNLLHHDHQHPFQPNAHGSDDVKCSSFSSETSGNQQHRPSAGKIKLSLKYKKCFSKIIILI